MRNLFQSLNSAWLNPADWTKKLCAYLLKQIFNNEKGQETAWMPVVYFCVQFAIYCIVDVLFSSQ